MGKAEQSGTITALARRYRTPPVKITLHTDTQISVTRLHEAGFEIESLDPEVHAGAIHLCVTSLAWCTYSVLASYGQRIEAGTDDMTVRLNWKYAERPHRIGHIDMTIHWPQVPESRLDAAMRAAAMCTLHNTLQHGAEIDTMIER
jgi:hypothetical protein